MSHGDNCRCESCLRTELELVAFEDEKPREIKRVKVGEISARLLSNGKIYIEGPMIMTRPLVGLTKENVLDLIVALDGVTNEMPDKTASWKNHRMSDAAENQED